MIPGRDRDNSAMTRQPTLRQLALLVSLHTHLHFGKAARASFVSQSTFSLAIKELESQLGATLVDRTSRKVLFTSFGQEVVEQARVVLREAAIINGFSSLAVNKLDILSGLPEIPVAAAWSIDGKRTAEFPMTLGEVARAEPIYESLPGWQEDLSAMREFAQLPANARRYIERIEQLAGVPVDLISVGPGRDQTLARRDPFAG